MTQEVKHTPAPWVLSENVNDTHDIPTTEYCIEDVHGEIVGIFTNKARAHLIVAAPDLISECQKQLEWLEHIHPQIKAHQSVMIGFDQAIKHLKKAIAKAKGGAS